MIKILIADDSAFMRKLLRDLFSKEADFELVGEAKTGKEAVDMVLKLKPNVLTLDVNMPVMDGLTALKAIMEVNPLPVLMLSSLTKEGASETIEALSLGAIDFIAKEGGSISKIDNIADDIVHKVRTAARAIVRPHGKITAPTSRTTTRLSTLARSPNPLLGAKTTPEPTTKTNPFQKQVKPLGTKLVAIGTSTGGPMALQAVIPHLPADLPAGVVVVQHMPAGFTEPLAKRLDGISKVKVKEAENHELIRAGTVYIAPGGYHMTVKQSGFSREISLNQDPPLANHRPAVDVLFDSVAGYGTDIVSVIMTGMGNDGMAGMKKIKAANGLVIAESKDTCTVYGMPKAVVEAGLADKVVPVTDIAAEITAAVRKK